MKKSVKNKIGNSPAIPSESRGCYYASADWLRNENRQKTRTHSLMRQYTVNEGPHGRKFLLQTEVGVFKILTLAVRIGTEERSSAVREHELP